MIVAVVISPTGNSSSPTARDVCEERFWLVGGCVSHNPLILGRGPPPPLWEKSPQLCSGKGVPEPPRLLGVPRVIFPERGSAKRGPGTLPKGGGLVRISTSPHPPPTFLCSGPDQVKQAKGPPAGGWGNFRQTDREGTMTAGGSGGGGRGSTLPTSAQQGRRRRASVRHTARTPRPWSPSPRTMASTVWRAEPLGLSFPC